MEYCRQEIGSRHLACVMGLTRTLIPALEGRALVGIHNPVRLGCYSEPEPDVSVLKPRVDLYASEKPRAEDVVFLIEVADSSLHLDTTIKLPLYAAAGIPELWIVDLDNNVVQANRQPSAGEYTQRQTLGAGSISPRAFPDLELHVEHVLRPTL